MLNILLFSCQILASIHFVAMKTQSLFVPSLYNKPETHGTYVRIAKECYHATNGPPTKDHLWQILLP